MQAPVLLPPFPTGWYAVGLSRQLLPGALHKLTFAGQEAILFRTPSGAASLMDAYCPHLGAHMGYGGSVVGESVRCPFHGFEYDVQGNCSRIPYGTRTPPKARARTWPLREINGLILAFHDPDGDLPAWEVPALDWRGWRPLLTRTWTLRGHPQETTENSVDLGHFAAIHGYTSVEMLKGLTVDGPYLNAAYAMVRPQGVFGRPVRAEFEVHVHGLGYSLVEVQVPSHGLQSRLFVLATPIDGQQINLRIAVSLREHANLARLNPLLAVVPRSLVHAILARAVLAGLAHDVQQDFIIWQHKRYVQPPILAEGDGPVGRYRQWARQFYRAFEAARV
jgi:nitrite reductase/ring-hydroxylating ferredoxin subunit